MSNLQTIEMGGNGELQYKGEQYSAMGIIEYDEGYDAGDSTTSASSNCEIGDTNLLICRETSTSTTVMKRNSEEYKAVAEMVADIMRDKIDSGELD